MTPGAEHGGVEIPERPVALLVIRAWTEEASPSDLRCRVLWTWTAIGGQTHAQAFNSVDDVCEVVRRWLERVAPTTW